MIGSAIATVLLVAIAIMTIVRLGDETSNPDGDQIANNLTQPSNDPPPPATDDSATLERQNDDNGFLNEKPTIPQLPIEQNTSFDPAPPATPDGPKFSAPDIPTVDNPPVGDLDVPIAGDPSPVSYTHLRAHETVLDLVCRLLLEKKK